MQQFTGEKNVINEEIILVESNSLSFDQSVSDASLILPGIYISITEDNIYKEVELIQFNKCAGLAVVNVSKNIDGYEEKLYTLEQFTLLYKRK